MHRDDALWHAAFRAYFAIINIAIDALCISVFAIFVSILGGIQLRHPSPVHPAAAWQHRKLETRQADGGVP